MTKSFPRNLVRQQKNLFEKVPMNSITWLKNIVWFSMISWVQFITLDNQWLVIRRTWFWEPNSNYVSWYWILFVDENVTPCAFTTKSVSLSMLFSFLCRRAIFVDLLYPRRRMFLINYIQSNILDPKLIEYQFPRTILFTCLIASYQHDPSFLF